MPVFENKTKKLKSTSLSMIYGIWIKGDKLCFIAERN